MSISWKAVGTRRATTRRRRRGGLSPHFRRLEIGEADDQGVQAALHKAYEDNLLRGRALIAARRLVEVRKRSGKSAKNSIGLLARTRPQRPKGW